MSGKKPSYSGPVFLNGGFRPMFLLGALWALVAMVLWLLNLTMDWKLPGIFDPIDWHVHELLYGFAPAVVCGFLVTAVPNWTGRLPVTGAPLGVLVGLWALGRGAVLFGTALPAPVIVIADLTFLSALFAIITREILAGKNWRNLPVLALVGMLLIGNSMFHISAQAGEHAAGSAGFRLGAGALVLLISLIGGRIIPSFTRNWLARQGAAQLPTPFNRLDQMTLITGTAAIVSWVALPEMSATGALLILAGAMNFVRMSRWRGLQTFPELLVLVLHISFGFFALGFLIMGASIIWPEFVPGAAGAHSWLVGGIATMMLAVMTRASRGHTGRDLVAGGAEYIIFATIILAALTRIWAAFPSAPDWTLDVSAISWIAAFGSFCVFYAPILLTQRKGAKKPSRARPTS